MFPVIDFSKKLLPANEYLLSIRRTPASASMQEFLAQFIQPRAVNAENFKEGVKKFIEVTQNKTNYYDNAYLGLHYATHLAELWNTEQPTTPIRGRQIRVVSDEWRYELSEEGYKYLIYKGQEPAAALNSLLLGPSIIDCGMFIQLGLWFGIRYILGDEHFNRCFGRAPLFITQILYDQIKKPTEPYLGNPLLCFLSPRGAATMPALDLLHVGNHLFYGKKHPGGSSRGMNCFVMDEKYSFFSQEATKILAVEKNEVIKILLAAFNSPQGEEDQYYLSLYAQHKDTLHLRYYVTYQQLIQEAEALAQFTIEEKDLLTIESDPKTELSFDLNKLEQWLSLIDQQPIQLPINYQPHAIANNDPLFTELNRLLPFENKSIQFSAFKQDSLVQKRMYSLALHFCHAMASSQSQFLILSGKPGIGKTAILTCVAKELIAAGKKIVFFTEQMVKKWVIELLSVNGLAELDKKLDKLLGDDIDAVFVDDENLAGYGGGILLEKVYSWYVTHQNKGLFITSNVSICFTHCYGHNLYSRFMPPPFNDYVSANYLNWHTAADLAGESLRQRRENQSIGAIVNEDEWDRNKDKLKHCFLIPAINISQLQNANVFLRKNMGKPGDCRDYVGMKQEQKDWLELVKCRKHWREKKFVPDFSLFVPRWFTQTKAKTIVLELNDNGDDKTISWIAAGQLIHLVNYAHDKGGRRVIFVNKTKLSTDELLLQIEQRIYRNEKERTISRLQNLLCEDKDSIFMYQQYDDTVTDEQEDQVDNLSYKTNVRNKNTFSFSLPSPYSPRDRAEIVLSKHPGRLIRPRTEFDFFLDNVLAQQKDAANPLDDNDETKQSAHKMLKFLNK